MDHAQYAELFLAESREHLNAVNQLLLEWERRPDAPEPVGGVFRAIHTIKGMAATMGYATVADLAHRTENLLDLLRRSAAGPAPDTLQLLFRTADALERAIQAAVSGQEADVDVGAVAAALDRVAASHESAAQRSEGARPSAPVVAAPTGTGRTVRVVLQPETPLKGARAVLLLARAKGLGAVHSVEPAPVALEAEEFDGRFVFRLESSRDDEELEAELRKVGEVAELTIGAAESAAPQVEGGAGRTQHIRVALKRLDALMDLVGELATAKNRLIELSTQRADPALEDLAIKIAQLSGQLQGEIVQARMTPVWQVFDRFPRLVRDLARQLDKQVSFEVEGKEIELDRAILDEMGDSLVHLLRNAVDHGIEPPTDRRAAGKPPEGRIVLSAMRERASVAIRVSDDGRGIDRAALLQLAKQRGMVEEGIEYLTDELLLRILARPGFSTAARVSDVSGRGVGIDAVAVQLRVLGGSMEIRTEAGQGTTFTLRVPTTLAIVRALIAQVGRERYAVPLTHVAETLAFDAALVTRVDNRDAMSVRADVVPLIHLRRLLQQGGEPPARRPVIILEIGDRRGGLVVDALAGQQEIVVKAFDPPQGTLPIFSGATILSDGAPALILDAGGLV